MRFCWSSSSLWFTVFCLWWLYCCCSTGCGGGVDGLFLASDAQVQELREKVESVIGLCTRAWNTENTECVRFQNSGNTVYSTRASTSSMNSLDLNTYITQSLKTGQNEEARQAFEHYEQLRAHAVALNTLIAELWAIKYAVLIMPLKILKKLQR